MVLDKAIKKIKSEYEQDQWYMSVKNATLYIAIGGFIDEANHLLEELWKHKISHGRTTRIDIAFEMLWYASGKRPANTPFEREDIYNLELSHRDYLINPLWASQWANKAIDPLTKGMVLAATENEKFPDSQNELEALSYLLKYFDNTDGKPPYQICQALSLVTELAARNNKEDEATIILKKWADKFGKYPYTSAAVLIGCNRHVAPLLVKGLIAEELELTNEKVKAFVDEAIVIIDERMKGGISLVYEELSWEQLLEKLSVLAINNEPDDYTELQKSNKWIGTEPAVQSVIDEVEKRLGIALPGDYKDFLKVSNGFSKFPPLNPRLVPIEKVDYLKNIYDVVYGETDMFGVIQNYPDKYGEGDIAELIGSAIAVSSIPDEQEIWLIPPSSTNADWECWFFAAWMPGEKRYRNFRYFIEEQIQSLEDK
jgi:hypothetical protein